VTDVGDWVTLPDGTVGQVWAEAGCRKPDRPNRMTDTCRHRGCPKAVWVADGTTFHRIAVADLLATQPALL
jgi:hypothetical protein